VLHPARFRENLGELLLRDGHDGACVIEDDGTRAGRPLIESENVFHVRAESGTVMCRRPSRVATVTSARRRTTACARWSSAGSYVVATPTADAPAARAAAIPVGASSKTTQSAAANPRR